MLIITEGHLISAIIDISASSHRINVFFGYAGSFPPPTNPTIFVFARTSTIPIPLSKTTANYPINTSILNSPY